MKKIISLFTMLVALLCVTPVKAADDDQPPWMNVVDFIRENTVVDTGVAVTPIDILQRIIM